ncbi:hypothetical protein BX600DRAFT_18740 [Xylariales sp. PMI_506]|nr:hypothetical protein BX600DRAFT_18740 [Xylariales sp. PMI_506]
MPTQLRRTPCCTARFLTWEKRRWGGGGGREGRKLVFPIHGLGPQILCSERDLVMLITSASSIDRLFDYTRSRKMARYLHSGRSHLVAFACRGTQGNVQVTCSTLFPEIYRSSLSVKSFLVIGILLNPPITCNLKEASWPNTRETDALPRPKNRR